MWVTFLFGPGLPILFPIATFGIIILYFTNKVALTYFCYRPKEYNIKVAMTIVQFLWFSPFLYVVMGAWVYSN